MTTTPIEEFDPFLDSLVTDPPGPADPASLSFAQERMWFLEQYAPGTTAYPVTVPLRLRGPLVIPALERSAAAIATVSLGALRWTILSRFDRVVPDAEPDDVVGLAALAKRRAARVERRATRRPAGHSSAAEPSSAAELSSAEISSVAATGSTSPSS